MITLAPRRSARRGPAAQVVRLAVGQGVRKGRHACDDPAGCSARSAYPPDGRRVPSPVVRMTEPTARELVDLNALLSPNSRLDARAKSAIGSLVTERSHHVLLRSGSGHRARVLTKGRCRRTASALPLPCLSECWVARGVGVRARSSATPNVCGMRLAAAHDLAPASAVGECKQPLVHSMGLIRLIETFCLRLRGMRRAIILEGSQGSFPDRGRRARPGGPVQVEGGPVTPPDRTSEIQSSREGLRWHSKAVSNCSMILLRRPCWGRLTRRGWPTHGWMAVPGSSRSGFTGPVISLSLVRPLRRPSSGRWPRTRGRRTIDGNEWPHKVLLVRTSECGDACRREPGVRACGSPVLRAGAGCGVGRHAANAMARIAITPGWVGILNLQTRFPSALTL